MGERTFYFKDGNATDDLAGLIKELDLMNDESFSFHVNSQKNDFAAWIQGSLGLNELAQELKTTTDKEQTKVLLENFLNVGDGEGMTSSNSQQNVSGADESVQEYFKEEPKDNMKEEQSHENKAQESTSLETKPLKEENKKDSENNDVPTPSSDEVIKNEVNNLKKEAKINKDEIFDEPLKNKRFSLTYALPSKPIRTLLLGTGFGIVLGMIIMLILVNLGIF